MISDSMQPLHTFSRNYYSELFAALGCSVKEQNGWKIVESHLDSKFFNAAIYLAGQFKLPFANVQERQLESISQPFIVWIEEASDTVSIRKQMMQNGLVLRIRVPIVSLQLKNLRPCPVNNLSITVVQSKEEFAEWTSVLATIVDCPNTIVKMYAELYNPKGFSGPFYHLIGRKLGRVVSTGTLYCHPDGAYLYNIATIENERGNGFATSLIAALLKLAFMNSCPRVSLLSSPAAVGIFYKMEFETVCRFSLFDTHKLAGEPNLVLKRGLEDCG